MEGVASRGEFVSLLLHAVKEPLLLSVLQTTQRLNSAQTRTNFPPWEMPALWGQPRASRGEAGGAQGLGLWNSLT